MSFLDPYLAENTDSASVSGENADCNLLLARRGQCTERVRFAPLPMAFSGLTPAGDLGEAWKALMKNTAELYLWELDGIASRWFRDDDPIATTILASSAVQALPQPSKTWKQAHPTDRRLISLPHEDSLLAAATWVEDRDTPRADPFFPLVEFHPVPAAGSPDPQRPTLPDLPEMALLKGRFAERLGFNSKAFPFEIMDGDEDSSGPFFEQMFPYNTERRADRPTAIRPLARFQDPGQILGAKNLDDLPGGDTQRPILLDDGDVAEFELRASQGFEEYSRLIGVSVARYALRDHTDNQMRILTALTAQRSPPDADAMGQGRYRGLVAAARGETDSDEQLGFSAQRDIGGVSGGVALRLRLLPPQVRADWLNRVVAEALESTATDKPRLRSSADEIRSDAEDRLRNDEVIGPLGLDPKERLNGLRSADVDDFINRAVTQKSRLRPFVFADAHAVTLGAVLNGLSIEDRDAYETWILLDHIDDAIATNLRAQGGAEQPPAAVSAVGQVQFAKVLATHGKTTSRVPQGLQSVDPLAICTRESGRAALSELSFKPVTLDLVVQGPDPGPRGDGADISPADVLWAARGQAPFLAVDDPEAAVPTVTRLSDLPGPDSLYRLRWRLWSGWHLLWSPQDLGDGRTRLAVRTAAICDDMVLTQRDLVPTVVRGGLLAGELFPTEPFRWTDLPRAERREAKRNLRLEGTIEGTSDLGSRLANSVTGGAMAAKSAQTDVTAVKTEGVGVLRGRDVQGAAAQIETRNRVSILESKRLKELSPGETAAYLHSIVHPKLRGLSKENGGLLLMVFDHDLAADNRPVGDGFRPRTPYKRRHRHSAGDPVEVRTASWTLWVPPEAGAPVASVGPGWRETDLATNAAHPVPRWKPRRPGDWTLMTSVASFPYRHVQTTCTDDPTTFDTVASCANKLAATGDLNSTPSYFSQGVGIDLGGMYTWWLMHRPRMAFESGLEGRLDVVPRGQSALYPNDPSYAWTFRWAGGALFGLRFAPRPTSLWRHGRDGNTWGPQRPEGGNKVGRTQWGLRGGVLFGPGFSGLETTFVTEAWMGRSIRRIRSAHQSFTPYHPALLVGPYVRGQLATPLPFSEPAVGHEVLDHAWTVLAGVRVNLRIKSQGPTLPAAP